MKHDVLGIDAFKGYDWCLAAAERTGGIVFPPIPLGPTIEPPEKETDPVIFDERDRIRDIMAGKVKLRGIFGTPSLFSSQKLCRALFSELLENFAQDLKFKLCVFVGTHGPSGILCRRMVEECGGTIYGMKVMAVGSLQYNLCDIQKYYKEQNIRRISHGGLWEASLNYAMNPDYFHPEYLDASKYPQTYGSLTDDFYEGCIRPVISEYRKLTPEFAATLRQITIDRLTEDVLKHYREIDNTRITAYIRYIPI